MVMPDLAPLYRQDFQSFWVRLRRFCSTPKYVVGIEKRTFIVSDEVMRPICALKRTILSWLAPAFALTRCLLHSLSAQLPIRWPEKLLMPRNYSVDVTRTSRQLFKRRRVKYHKLGAAGNFLNRTILSPVILTAHIKAKKTRNSTTRSKLNTHLLLQTLQNVSGRRCTLLEKNSQNNPVVKWGLIALMHCVCAGIIAIVSGTFSLSLTTT